MSDKTQHHNEQAGQASQAGNTTPADGGEQVAASAVGPKDPHRVVSTPGLGVLRDDMSIPGLLLRRLEQDPQAVVYERKSSLGTSWIPVTVQTFYEEVMALARGLIALGIEPGDAVAIMSRTRYEWSLCDFAIWAAGAIPVPIYETSSVDQCQWIVESANVKMAFAESHAQATILRPLLGADISRNNNRVFVFDENGLARLAECGTDISEAEVLQRIDNLRADDVATIIFTSGTTGRPKGAELLHRSLLSSAVHGPADPSLRPIIAGHDTRTLLFLPLAHVYARFLEVLCMHTGVVMGHAPDAKNLVADLQSFKPTIILAVPRVFEKVYNAADASTGGGAKQKMFRWAAKVAITFSRAMDTPEGPSFALQAQKQVAERLVFSKITSLMGGKLRHVISGAAPLGERLGHFYRGIGVTIIEGYGLTETSAPTTVNSPSNLKIGTVGFPFPGGSIRIGEDGEIQAKGDHIFARYHNDEENTRAAFTEDGWFITGDIGSIDDDGFLTITGRKKELIVTAGGKNVSPAILEDRLRGHPLVSQVVVVGDKKPFIAALVTLDEDMLPSWLESHGLPHMTVDEAAENPQVLAALDRAVKRANKAVSRAESIRKISVLTTDFTEQNGYLTPSMKVKRHAVHRDFAKEIEAFYS